MKWPFTKKKHRTPTPVSLSLPLFSLPLAGSPTFVSQRSFIHQRNCADPVSSQATRLSLSTDRAANTAAHWWRAVRCLAMSRLLVQMAFNSACFLLKLHTVISSRQAGRVYVPPPPWNPTSAPVVSPRESRWLQQSEKCLEFANPGLWASSCLACFLLAWYLQLSVCSLSWGSAV